MSKPNILGLITARAGSKRIPKKNLKKLGGKPLIQWTIDSAKKSNYISDLVVTSDDLELLDLCRKEGCQVPFVRPKSLATDTSSSFDAIEHALLNLEKEYDWLVLLQPTSPFRTTEHIDQAIEKAVSNDCNSLISIRELPTSHCMNLLINEQGGLQTVSQKSLRSLNQMRSQDMPKTYEINGAIYVSKTNFLLREKVAFDDESLYFLMPEEASINIDTYHDWDIAEYYVRRLVS